MVFKAWKSGNKSTYYTRSSNDKVIEAVENEAHIITRDDCIYCEKAKRLMDERGINYTEYKREDVTHFPWKTVPQIWYQGHFVGGYDDLVDIIAIQNKRETNLNLMQQFNNLQEQAQTKEQAKDYDKECISCQG